MKILLHTRFYPSVGGVETVASLLAHEWVKAGEDVAVITDVAKKPRQEIQFVFPVYHRPSRREFLRLLRAHDVFIHFNVSLRSIWPLLFVRRPFIATHHGFYVTNEFGRRDWREKLKLFIARCATENIAVSKSVARSVGIECKVIENPFSGEDFKGVQANGERDGLIFLGRLVSSKGADLLLKALKYLKDRNLTPRLTIIGEGPERLALQHLTNSLNLGDQVRFTGAMATEEAARLLCAHKIMVVPSIWNEGFGVVTLEGIASGCVIVASDSGGLPEATGECGLLFATGNAWALAAAIERLLTEDELPNALRSNASDHLARHSPPVVAERYLEIIHKVSSR